MAFHSNKPFSSIGLAPLIAKMGFPIPIILALWITFNESIGAFLIGCGFLTRALAISGALGMIGALYTSVQLGEDWLRAALYLIAFVTLSLTGPCRFSIDRSMPERSKEKSLRCNNCAVKAAVQHQVAAQSQGGRRWRQSIDIGSPVGGLAVRRSPTPTPPPALLLKWMKWVSSEDS